MAGQRQPTELVLMKGKKHFTKAEIEARKNAEVVAPNDKVKPPAYCGTGAKEKVPETCERTARNKVDCKCGLRCTSKAFDCTRTVH